MRLRISLLASVLLLFLSLPGGVFAKESFWVPGTGFGSMSFTPGCALGQLVLDVDYDETDGYVEFQALQFRQRLAGGNWGALETVTNYAFDTFDSSLFYIDRGAGAQWETYYLEETNLVRYLRDADGNWTETDSTAVTSSYVEEDMYSPSLLASEMTADNTLHFAVMLNSMEVRYIRFNGTSFDNELAATFTNRTEMKAFDSPHQFRPRNLSLAVSTDNVPHIVYSADQTSTVLVNGTTEISKLFYLTKVGGSWQKQTLIDPGTRTDDAGLGVSIDIAPDGTIAVASTYMPRAVTGSPGVAQLRYLYKNPNNSWNSSIIVQSSDGYLSGDGQRGTGLYPYLQFDGKSQPHIAFTDHASEHLSTAWSYSGQLRYTTRSSAKTGAWKTKTIVKQPTSDAFLRRLDYPVVAASNGQCGNLVAVYGVSLEHSENPFRTNYFNHFSFIEGESPPPPPPPETDGEAMPWLFLLLNP